MLSKINEIKKFGHISNKSLHHQKRYDEAFEMFDQSDTI